jgi:hypothetical protein
VAYNFQTGNSKIKLLMAYESATQTVLLSVEEGPPPKASEHDKAH